MAQIVRIKVCDLGSHNMHQAWCLIPGHAVHACNIIRRPELADNRYDENNTCQDQAENQTVIMFLHLLLSYAVRTLGSASWYKISTRKLMITTMDVIYNTAA